MKASISSAKKFSAVFLAALLVILTAVPALAGIIDPCKTPSVTVERHSRAEISKRLHQTVFYTGNPYETAPNFNAPYSAGKINKATLDSACDVLSTFRYVAGLNSVSIDDSCQQLSQAAAVVNYCDESAWISHYPQRPTGMGDALYDLGAKGAASSNLAAGYADINSAIMSWMDDTDSSNIIHLGHRRWCLSPVMQYTGFGIADNIYSMYALDSSYNSNVDGIAWPAQDMPIEMWYDGAWSFSTYSFLPSDTTVTLKRARDGKTWTFSSSKADGFFNLSNGSYGYMSCAIFMPDDLSVEQNDSFTVTLRASGWNKPVSYNVGFFSAYGSEYGIKGDLDKDGKVTVSDARSALRIAVSLDPSSSEAVAIGDMNGNNAIDVSDARMILRTAVGLEDLIYTD